MYFSVVLIRMELIGQFIKGHFDFVELCSFFNSKNIVRIGIVRKGVSNSPEKRCCSRHFIESQHDKNNSGFGFI